MSESDPPFKQSHRVLLPGGSQPLVNIAPFPWSEDSFKFLWAGKLTQSDFYPEWRAMIKQYSHLAAATDGQKLWLVSVQRKDFHPIRFELPTVQMPSSTDPEYVNSAGVAWAMLSEDNPTEPLILLAVHSIVFVISAVSQLIVGVHRGHGGSITSIVVHPNMPHIFATTSRDMTTRLYDLQMSIEQSIINKHGGRWPSNTGAPHGLRAFEKEGEGIGCCFCVLVGGRSGGHNAAVLHAAFHPNYPIIATCGVDRACKIWRYWRDKDGNLAREDKPLFSTSNIHKARVVNIAWIKEDLLVSHSPPALMRYEDNDNVTYKVDDKSGTMVLWRWLSLERYFPRSLAYDQEYQHNLRGCISDYKESESWQFISTQYVPIPSWATEEDKLYKSAHLYLHLQTSPGRTPLFLYTPIMAKSIYLLRPKHLKKHELHMPKIDAGLSQEGGGEEPLSTTEQLLEGMGGWEVSIAGELDVPMMIRSCALTRDGRYVVAVGMYRGRGCFWVLVKS